MLKPADILISNIRIRFSFLDVIKLLFDPKREANIRIETECENLPGRVESTSHVSIPGLVGHYRGRMARGGGYAGRIPNQKDLQ